MAGIISRKHKMIAAKGGNHFGEGNKHSWNIVLKDKIHINQIAVNILQEAGNKLKEDEDVLWEAGDILMEARRFIMFSGII